MINMAPRTCVLPVQSRISHLSFHTTQKEQLTDDVRNLYNQINCIFIFDDIALGFING